MARLWSCGFELQSIASAVEWDTTSGNITIDTTIKRSGSASLQIDASGVAMYLQHQYNATQQNVDIYVRFYLYITTPTDALDSILVLRDGWTNGNTCSIRLNSNRTLELWNDGASVPSQQGSDSAALDAGTWYRVELYYDRTSDTGGNLTAYLNGTEFASGSVVTGEDTPNIIRLGCVTATTALLNFDDIAVNDETGSYQNGLPGEGKIVHLKPNDAGDNNPTAGTYADIDEVIPDDNGTYIELDNGNDIGDFNLEASSVAGIDSGDTISLVQVGIRERAETAALESWQLRIKSQLGGTVLASATTTHNDITWRTNGDTGVFGYQLTSYVDPQAGGAWTTTLLDSAQIGIQAIDATPDIYVSTMWALIEYVTGGAPPSGVAQNWPVFMQRGFRSPRYA